MGYGMGYPGGMSRMGGMGMHRGGMGGAALPMLGGFAGGMLLGDMMSGGFDGGGYDGGGFGGGDFGGGDF